MLPYWLLFSYFAFGGLVGRNRTIDTDRSAGPLLAFGAFLIALMIGFRYRVGADWTAYLNMYNMAAFIDLDRLITMGDPGYQILNWSVQQLGGGIWLVNLICGTVFAWGLYRLASAQPLPWLAMLVAIPYLVVVVAMGYARQGVAIGVLMAGLAHISRGGSFGKFIIYVAVAGLFHRTAVLVLPLAVLGSHTGRVVNIMIIIAGGLFLFDYFLSSHVDKFIRDYIQTKYSSQGAAIRIAMSVIPALIFFAFSKRLYFNKVEKAMWRNFSVAAIVLLVMLMVLPSSTAVDRIALYILPLQVAVISRISLLIRSDFVGRFGVLLYSFFVMYVWLNYADNANAWVPYKVIFSSLG